MGLAIFGFVVLVVVAVLVTAYGATLFYAVLNFGGHPLEALFALVLMVIGIFGLVFVTVNSPVHIVIGAA